MALFWIAHRGDDDEPIVYLQEANTAMYARLAALRAGLTGEYREVHELDAKMARKVPKTMIGRMLNQLEIADLLRRLGG